MGTLSNLRHIALLMASVFLLPSWGYCSDKVDRLPELTVKGERAIAASSQRIIPHKEIVLQPQGRPADLLRLVPGVVTLEHSGGSGKADQYLLRGFDADHGTDLALFLDD
ncbi:MAG: Plug domain-containing protein, partial [Nitrospirae bacterium]